jgi:hypothetical protein
VALLAPGPLVYGAGALATAKVVPLAPALARGLVLGAAVVGAVFIGGVLHAALRRRSPLAGAQALDRHHGLQGRVANALAFAAEPADKRAPLAEAAIDDGVAVAATVSARKAVPLRRPDGVGVAVLLAGCVTAIALLEVPVVRFVPAEKPKALETLLLAPDDVELFRREGEELLANVTDPEAQAGARRFNQIVEDLAERRLDRGEVYRRLDELERGLDADGLDSAALDEALDDIARELDRSALSKPLAKALSEKRLEDAEREMRDLAKKVENAKKTVDKDRLEELRKALTRAAEKVKNDAKEADRAIAETEEARKRLLKKKQEKGLTDPEKRELERLDRKLERLQREKQQAAARERELSGLDKELAKAAEDLMRDLGMSAKDLERGAEDINRAAQKKMSQAQKEELKRKIEELRETLRQEGQAGRERIKRMMAFGDRARGGQGQGKDRGQEGSGKGKRGSGEQPGQGGDGKELRIGPGRPGGEGAVVMMPGGSAPGGSEGGEPGSGAEGAGREWGQGHDPSLAGKATSLEGDVQDVTAQAAETGQGTSSSQVIYGAAERGFTGRGYKKVFTDYQTVAEESLGKDEIPPGYRFYVKRYFQLIRPRD